MCSSFGLISPFFSIVFSQELLQKYFFLVLNVPKKNFWCCALRCTILVTHTHNKMLNIVVVLVPRPLEEEENGLVLAASNGTKGLELSGFITANTYSEKLNFIFTVQNVSSIVEKGLLDFFLGFSRCSL